jgi:hypothetical protein
MRVICGGARLVKMSASKQVAKEKTSRAPLSFSRSLDGWHFSVYQPTKERKGSWFVSFKYKDINEVAMLTQARIFSYKRLDRKMGEIKDTDFKKVKEAFKCLFSE